MSGETGTSTGQSKLGGALSVCVALLGVAVGVLGVREGLTARAQAATVLPTEAPALSAGDADDLEAGIAQMRASISRMEQEQAAMEAASTARAHMVVSVTERFVEHREKGVVTRFNIAVGKGATWLGGKKTRFDTPTGRFEITGKEEDPRWQPPSWHFEELAGKHKAKITEMKPGASYALADGRSLTVQGKDVGYVDSAGAFTPVAPGENIVTDGRVFVPPYGSNQRYYPGVLGTHRLLLRDGYAFHGTNNPNSIGTASSHGCMRLRNEDIAKLYPKVAVKTPVFIY